MWRSTAALIASLVIFALLASALSPTLAASLKGGGLMSVGIILALIPAAIWLFVFYLQDRLEPEPKNLILSIFLLGALLAQGVALPLIYGLFRVSDWLNGASPMVTLLGSILIVGFIQEYLKYAGVRFTLYRSPEFDERVDGIIYGAAIGLGFATMLSLNYVISNGGVLPGIGATRITIEALAQASFAGVSGYFLGRAKFEEMPAWWLPIGVSLAAILNGVVSYLLDAVSRQGLIFTPTYSLILAAVIAGGTFSALFMLIRRANAATLATAR
jgi:RsiW-degrading membrane proteinase PrsW (M82 family)